MQRVTALGLLVVLLLPLGLVIADAKQPLQADLDKTVFFWVQKDYVKYCRNKDGSPDYRDKSILFVDDELPQSRISSILIDLQNYAERYERIDFDEFGGMKYLVLLSSSYDYDWVDKYSGIPLLVHIVTEDGETIRVPAFMGMPEFERAGDWWSGWRVGNIRVVVMLPVDPSEIAALVVYPNDAEGVMSSNDCAGYWQLALGFAPEAAAIDNVSVTVEPQLEVKPQIQVHQQGQKEHSEQPQPMAGHEGGFDETVVAAAAGGAFLLGVAIMYFMSRRR